MRHLLTGAAVGLALAATSAVLGAPAASAACPNEAFRTGPSAQLAECRAYEQVTPVDKESGNGVYKPGQSRVSPTGDSVYFTSLSGFAGPQSVTYYNPYVATRAGDAWGTEAIGGPQAAQVQQLFTTTYAVSDDLAYSFMASKEALAPGAVPYGSNLYLRDNRTGTYTTVSALPGDLPFYESTQSSLFKDPFAAASRDWGHILVSSTFVLAPGGVEGQPNLYEFAEGRLRLAVAEASAANANAFLNSSEVRPNVMSADGSRFYYMKEGLLYLHPQGQGPLRVSEDEEGNPVGVAESGFIGATPSGDAAFFRSGALFRFEASAPSGARVTQLTPPTGLEGFRTEVTSAYTNQAANFVYFSAVNRLTADAEPEGEDGRREYLYVWHGEPGQRGQIRFIGDASLGNTTSIRPDGRFLGFEEIGQVTPDAIDGTAASCPGQGPAPAGRCGNVFLYSYDADRLACASCSGAPPSGSSSLGETRRRDELSGIPRTVLDDGTVFLETPNALSPRDVNGAGDVYAWRGGVAQLISSGTGSSPSFFVNASADGSNVFFGTEQPLVGQDIDAISDLYDARVDGGLPQGGIPGNRSCILGNDCRAGSTPASPPAQLGTGTVGAGERTVACSVLADKAQAAAKRSRALARRAKRTKGERGHRLRKAAARKAKTAGRLRRRAGHCGGGGR